MIKWIVKWVFRLAFRLVLLVVVLVIVLLLSLNTIVRVSIEHNIRAQTGMDAEIGRVEVGWTEPTFELRDVKIYNPPSFGGTPFLDIPEIHIEYDQAAFLRKQVHLTLLRLNLAEMDIVRNRKGDINIFAVGTVPQKSAMIEVARQILLAGVFRPLKKQTDYNFKGIDALNVSFNKVKFIDLENPRNNREQTLALQNCVVPDVKSVNDLANVLTIIELRSNHFFDPIVEAQFKSAPLKGVLNMMGGAL